MIEIFMFILIAVAIILKLKVMNEIKLQIPEYIREEGLILNWDDSSEVEVKIEGEEVLLFANKEGLISLANLFLNLSQANVPSGVHIHLDSYSSLEDDSNDMIVGKR